MRRRLQGTFARACVLTVSLCAGTAQAAYDGEYLGVNVQAMVKRGFAPETWPGFLGTARKGGFTTVRQDASWGAVEPTPPQGQRRFYRWESLDPFVTATASAGLRWTPVMSVVPGWARDADGRFTAGHYADFVEFTTAFVRRYGAGGDFWRAHPELPVLPPAVYEVWNEPNSTNAWNGTPEPAAYAALFAQMRDAIKRVDPGASVLVSLGWQHVEGFVDVLAASGDPAWAGDGIAFHPYAPTVVGTSELMRRLAGALAANGRPGLPLYVNEIGWPRAFAAPAAHAWDGMVSDETRAASLSIIGDALERSDCNVRAYAPYSLVEPEQDQGNVEDWMGILHRDGYPTAAFTALAASARREAGPGGGTLALCGRPGTSDSRALLPLSLQASRTSAACFVARVDYAGNPLEQATLTAYRGDDRSSAETDSSGAAKLCAPTGSAPLVLRAAIRDVAVSDVLACPADRSRCAVAPDAVVGEPAGGVDSDGTHEPGGGDFEQPGDGTSPPVLRCGVRLVGPSSVPVRHGRATLRIAARDACKRLEPQKKVRARLYIRRSGGQRRVARSVELSRRSRTVTVRVRGADRQLLLVGRTRETKPRKITSRIALRRSRR